jgi:hypothetical protein
MKLEHFLAVVIKAMTDEELDVALEALRELLAQRASEAANVIEGTAEPVGLPRRSPSLCRPTAKQSPK